MTNQSSQVGAGDTNRSDIDFHHNEEQQPVIQSIKQSLTKILPPTHNDTNSHVAKFVTGTLAFYTTSLISQCIQYKLKISTGTRPTIIPIMIGGATVAMGSYMGHVGGVGVQICWNKCRNIKDIAKVGLDSVKECIAPMKLMFERDENLSRGERREKRDIWVHTAGV